MLAELILESIGLHPDQLHAAVSRAATVMGGTDISLLVVDLQQQSLAPIHADDPFRRLPVDDSPAGQAFRQRRTVAVTNGPAHVRLWLPILDSADRLGVLGVTVPAEADRRGFEALASLTGELLASKAPYGDGIAMSRRTRSTTVAAELRWAMLPPLTFVSPEVLISGILEPAYEIAGDTFDYAVNGRTAHLGILDAMGHGLEASRMANLAVASYRHSRRAGRTLRQAIEELDQVISEQFGASRYVTGQLATLDLDHGTFRMLNLGHPLPLLLRGGQVVGELRSEPALPAGLGALAGEVFEVQLQPGDAVLLHTDGITEARPPGGQEYGQDRLVRLVTELVGAGERPEEVLRRVVNAILEHQDQRPRDDATLLFVSWRPPDRWLRSFTVPAST